MYNICMILFYMHISIKKIFMDLCTAKFTFFFVHTQIFNQVLRTYYMYCKIIYKYLNYIAHNKFIDIH